MILTEEEGDHLRGCDALGLRNMVWQICETRPYCGYHDLNYITAICRLNRKPEHGQDDSRNNGH